MRGLAYRLLISWPASFFVAGTVLAMPWAIAPWRRDTYHWTEVPPTLEDVFIQLMGAAQDNFQ